MPDAVGNLYKNSELEGRKYGKAGELLETDKVKLKYDADGNLIERLQPEGVRWAYTWAANGMLRSVVRPDRKAVEFEYDALGRRTAKVFDERVTRFVWDGNNPLHEWSYSVTERPQKVTDEFGFVSVVGIEPVFDVTTWVFEEGTFRPTAKITADEKFSIMTDYLGTPAQMYDRYGIKVWDCTLDIYGKVRKFEGTKYAPTACDCPFRYQGQYEDAETGLYYNRFRYYSPDMGMYLSQDPISIDGGLNLYSYVFDTNLWLDIFGLTGTYMFNDGTTWYIGKGPKGRMEASIKERVGGSQNVKQGLHIDYGNNQTGLMVEAELMRRKGAVAAPEFANKINSPGEKLLENVGKNNIALYDDIVSKADDFESKFNKLKGKGIICV